jgi:uncharacterized protein (TIGR01244 family)
MEITHITPEFSVSGELSEAELMVLADQGVDTLINVRPDNEAEGQINHPKWQVLAKNLHIEYGYIPVKPGEYSEQDIAKFDTLLTQSKTRVHSFCRTGARAVHLWALANKNTLAFDRMHDIAKQKGYDLNLIKAKFENVNGDI